MNILAILVPLTLVIVCAWLLIQLLIAVVPLIVFCVTAWMVYHHRNGLAKALRWLRDSLSPPGP